MSFKRIIAFLRRQKRKFMVKFFPVYACRERVFKRCKYWPDFKNPKTLNEKLHYLKFNRYCKDPVVSDCIDKYKVREYVEARGMGHTLVKLLGVWDRADQINWDELPDKFAIKCNHGSGWNILCTDKSTFDTAAAAKKLDQWMHQVYGGSNVELIYNNIQPKIICEEYIETDDGLPPRDYKVFCSWGKPKLVFVATERIGGGVNGVKFDYFDLDWNWYDVRNVHPNADVRPEKPEFLDELLAAAAKLAEGFPLVRVDFYHENGRLYFGELTFLHFGGTGAFEPLEYDRIFGDMFPLEK